MFGSCRVRETKRENVHASSYRCGTWVAWTQPLAVHKFKTYLLFNLHSSCGSAERKSSGLSLSFHIKEGVAMQPSLPAADWGETGKQTESGGRNGIRGWISSCTCLTLKQSFHCSFLISLVCWKIYLPVIVPIIVICELTDKSKLLIQ